MGPASCGKGGLGKIASRRSAFANAGTFHVGHLCQYSNHQFTSASAYLAEAVDLQRYAFLKQSPNRCLHINGIATQTVNGIDVDRVAFPDIVQHGCKARSGGGGNRA